MSSISELGWRLIRRPKTASPQELQKRLEVAADLQRAESARKGEEARIEGENTQAEFYLRETAFQSLAVNPPGKTEETVMEISDPYGADFLKEPEGYAEIRVTQTVSWVDPTRGMEGAGRRVSNIKKLRVRSSIDGTISIKDLYTDTVLGTLNRSEWVGNIEAQAVVLYNALNAASTHESLAFLPPGRLVSQTEVSAQPTS